MARFFFDLTSLAAVGFNLLSACASAPAPEDSAAQTREAAYQQCLKDSMAVAMAWEAIEAMCRKNSEADGDPLNLRPDAD
ncbi:MAG TPA: hypothetical protein VNH64_01265 [Parvularculaceae bacterium]|nr:hypothetical protein [Parvularculaceae bacterium]